MEHQSSTQIPHVLIFPVPLQGHVGPLLDLAELLCLAYFKITFLHTTHNHQWLTKHTDIEARFSRYPGFKYKTVPDGLPDAHPRTDPLRLSELFKGLASSAKPLLRDILVGDKVTCLILDEWLSFAYEIASEVQVPVMAFSTSGACFTWILHCIPKLVEAGDIPFKDEEMDKLVKNAPGMDSFLRYRDLPSFCRKLDTSSCRKLQHRFSGEIQLIKQAHSFILNTFEDLEGPCLSLIREHCSKVYSIGPLHAHLDYKLGTKEKTLSNTNNFLEVDQSCISWLDHKPDKSVVYVSFGSLAILTKDQLTEFWVGLVQSNKYFLWVIRPDLVIKSDLNSPITQDYLLDGTKKRGCIVKWAPQKEVLAHRAVGGFFTHCGWNSILESIVTGVPMLCWPYFTDQLINSRYVSYIWKIGLDMKDTCDRTRVKNMINDLMERKHDKLETSMSIMSHLTNKSISEGGSSYTNLDHLIEEIKAFIKKEPTF
ncbi:7-deoxyloganetic acid glucosyltransferase-like [Chenopodium quinoa]|uniref:7-deoxyloganetic acid glucosyltransferase-like n=1 Tax=Chenopodium quinoa TaxID=63459 RepID=UPI000B77BE7A|nr:7-deoxyloganetic acid glucosyltransferase-like [Chenopodium quinoa]